MGTNQGSSSVEGLNPETQDYGWVGRSEKFKRNLVEFFWSTI